jgi:Flp pilus assembly protein TadD
MSLVKLALALPSEERASYLDNACAGNPQLLDQVQNYVQAEERMKGFLLEPLYTPPTLPEYRFQPDELLDGRFRIVREVAKGGMGVVYEAVDEKLSRRIALKSARAGYHQRLPPEVRHASDVGHPNVCKIFEIHSTSTPAGRIEFITMEFLDGETLAQRLRRGPLPEAEAQAIALQLCAGLGEAHRKGVIHGDLKTANVILTAAAGGTPRPVITDFGMARCSETSHGSLESRAKGGTPAYMAPELWRGDDASVASDIYALGVILYEMVAGRRPHETTALAVASGSSTVTATGSAPAIFWKERLTGKPPLLHSRWDSVLARCLDPDPTRRFKTADEVIRALGPSRTRRWILAIAAALALAAASGLITYYRAIAPKETVRLAIQPFEFDTGAAALAPRLFRDSAATIGRIASSARTKFVVLPAKDARSATHALHATLAGANGRATLHASLTDVRTGVNNREWTADYAPGELRYAPVALAGMVSGTFHLPPLTNGAAVNRAALADYQAGLAHVRRESETDAALDAFARAVFADPDSALTFAGLAEAQWFKFALTLDRVWFQRARESVRQAEERNPDVAAVHRIAGLLKYRDGWYDQAAAEYDRAIELDAANGDAYRLLGQAKERNNQLEQALAAYQRAIELAPDYYRNYQALADFYNSRGKYNSATQPLRKVAALVPLEPKAHFGLGANYQDLGHYSDAERELRLAIQLKETFESRYSLGNALLYQRRFKEAIPNLVRALELKPLSYLPWMELGVCYSRVGLSSEAAHARRRGLELAQSEVARNPRNGRHRSFLAYFCAQMGDRGRAESEIAQALQLSPQDLGTHFTAALTYEALGKRDSTLDVVATFPAELLADLSRYPEVDTLRTDPRFARLLVTQQSK